MGATDVCHSFRSASVSWEEAVECGESPWKTRGEELKIPVYLYEKAAKE